MNVNYGPRSVEDIEAMWREIRAGEFPEHPCLHVTCPTWFDALQAPPAKHTASVFMPVPYQLKGHQPEDWVRLKDGFMEQVLSALREVATNLTDDNIVMKVPMDPCYLAGRWQNMRRGSVWVARKTPDQMGDNRPIPQLAQYRTPYPGPLPSGRGHAPGGRGHRRLRARGLERPAGGPGPGDLKERQHEGG